MDDAEAAANMQAINTAIASPSVPKVVINGFRNTLSPGGDFISVATLNGSPQAVLVMSYSMAKSLAAKMAELIQNFETSTQTTVPSVDELAKFFSGG